MTKLQQAPLSPEGPRPAPAPEGPGSPAPDRVAAARRRVAGTLAFTDFAPSARRGAEEQ